MFGLGNPGKPYHGTRHNLGSFIVQKWWQQASDEEKRNVVVIKPQLSMNQSGEQLKKFLAQTPIPSADILIVHDDMELPLGELQLVNGGSAKGHNGVRSIHENLGTQDIPRLRIGIGRPPVGVDPSEYVLSKFTTEEQPRIENIVKEACRIITSFITSSAENTA